MRASLLIILLFTLTACVAQPATQKKLAISKDETQEYSKTEFPMNKHVKKASPAAVKESMIDDETFEDEELADLTEEIETPLFDQQGLASWYGPGFHGRKTANGENFNQNAMTAAHRKLPLGSMVEVTNLETGKTVTVRINDRGPYSGHRIIDLSKAAAAELELLQNGVGMVGVKQVE